ncbi:MAG: carbohydrate kinase family protein [Enterocloster asparagiformis]|nr:carbohydrate kinase family protein [Enterocloster asparagiformis]
MKFDVVGIDMPCVDFAVNVDHFPDPNGGERIRELSWQGGGKVATGLVAAARLGAGCAVLGAVGNDSYGRFCDKDFIRHGIDTKHLLKREGRTTSLSLVLSNRETMGRAIIYNLGTAEKLEKNELAVDYLKNARYLHLAMLDDVAVEAARIAREAGVKVFLDADSYSDELGDFIPMVDVFVASEFVYEAMFQDRDYEANCRKVMERGPEIVVFTFGEKGCVGLSREGYFELPAYHVEVVDTVGAGDVYHGAFLAGLLKGWTVEKTAQFSSAVSAIKCTRIGGRAAIPDMETVMRFMETGEINYAEIDQRVEFYKRGIDHV